MKDILICLDKNLNNYGDIDISSGDLSLKGNEKQKVFIYFRIFEGEWFLDKKLGVPYFQYILQKGITKESIDMVISNKLNICLGAKNVKKFSSSIDDDTKEYSFNCEISGKLIEGGFNL